MVGLSGLRLLPTIIDRRQVPPPCLPTGQQLGSEGGVLSEGGGETESSCWGGTTRQQEDKQAKMFSKRQIQVLPTQTTKFPKQRPTHRPHPPEVRRGGWRDGGVDPDPLDLDFDRGLVLLPRGIFTFTFFTLFAVEGCCWQMEG